MKHLIDIIDEGIFDISKNTEDVIDKISTEDILSKSKGKFKVIYLKDGSAKITGKLIVSDDAKGLYIKCSSFKGQLIIENCPNLKTIKNSFLKNMYVFDGSIIINNCPQLENLDGLPEMIKGDLHVSNCKKIKDLGTCDSVFGDILWSHNGKKLTKDQILDKTHCIGYVLLESLEEVDESLSNPWLQKLARQIKQYSEHTDYKERKQKNNLVDVLGSNIGLLDKVDSNDITVYDMKDKNDKKDVLKLIFNTYSSTSGEVETFDRMLIFDSSKDEFVECFENRSYKYKGYRDSYPTKVVYKYSIPTKDHQGVINRDVINQRDIKSYVESLYAYKVIIIRYSEGHDYNTRYNISRERTESQKGMINPGDANQYKAIAQENIRRYKQILAETHAKNKSSEFEDVSKKVNDILERAMKLSMDIIRHPEKYKSYDLNLIFDKIRDATHYNHGKIYGEDGLLIRYKNLVNSYQSINTGNVYGDPKSKLESLNKQKDELLAYVDILDSRLKNLGF